MFYKCNTSICHTIRKCISILSKSRLIYISIFWIFAITIANWHEMAEKLPKNVEPTEKKKKIRVDFESENKKNISES